MKTSRVSAWLMVAACCLHPSVVAAQTQAQPSTQVSAPATGTVNEAIPVGPFLFSPSIYLNWQYRDNIFFTEDETVDDQLLTAGARLLFEMPINESFIRFSYSPQYTDYRTYELEDKWAHYFDLGGRFVFSNGLILDATYNYIMGNLQTSQVDPGGELYYGDPHFVKQFAGLGAEYWFSHRDGLFVEADWTDLDHTDPELFYDYTIVGAAGGWVHQMGPNLVMDLRYRVSDFDAHDTFVSSNEFRDSTSQELTLGFRGAVNPVLGTEIRLGYMVTEYDLQPGDPEVSDFEGFILNGFLDWSLGHGSVVRLEMLRMPFPSYYGNNANYLATGAALQYSLDRGSVYGSASGRFQNNDYELPDPATGEMRSDDIFTLGLGMGVRFNPYLSLWGSYVYEDRESLRQFTYTSNIYTVGLVFGF